MPRGHSLPLSVGRERKEKGREREKEKRENVGEIENFALALWRNLERQKSRPNS